MRRPLGLTSLVAQNVSVEIRPRKDVQLLGILNGFPQVAVGGGVQVQLGDAYGKERRRVVFQLHVAELATLGVAKVAEVLLHYVTLGEQVAVHETRVPLTVNLVSADEAAAAEADHEVTEEVVVLKAARAQTQAREHADRGEFEIARKLLSEAAEDLRTTAPGCPQADELLATAEMLGENFTSMAPGTYDPSVRKAHALPIAGCEPAPQAQTLKVALAAFRRPRTCPRPIPLETRSRVKENVLPVGSGRSDIALTDEEREDLLEADAAAR